MRLRILEGRRSPAGGAARGLPGRAHPHPERLDSYTLELQQHGLESVEREVRWLNELIETSGDRPRPGDQTNPRARMTPPSDLREHHREQENEEQR